MEIVTEIKLQVKQAPASPLFMFAYSYRLFKKFSTFSSPKCWIHTCSFRNCLESTNNVISVQDNGNCTEFRAPLHEVYIEGGSSRCVVELK